MTHLISYIDSAVSYLGPCLVLLGLLIFVHELGHFLVAKLCGVRVETFSLGFGKKILEFKRGDTTYCVSIIPLGGYVKMYGDDPSAEVPADQRQYAFLKKPVLPRIAIVLAGPLMNLFFAILVFTCVAVIGEKFASPILGDVNTSSPAYSFGFRSGDKLVSVADAPVATWDEASEAIKAHPNQKLKFKVLSSDGASKDIEADTSLTKNDNPLSSDVLVGAVEGINQVSRGPVVGVNNQEGALAKAGLGPIEHIKKINGKDVRFFRNLESELSLAATSGKLELTVTPEFLNHSNDDVELADKIVKIDLSTYKPEQNILEFLGATSSELFLFEVKDKTPAFRAGLLPGDQILALNDQSIKDWDQVQAAVKSYKGDGQPITVDIMRKGAKNSLKITPELTELMDPSGGDDKRYTIGIVPAILGAVEDPVLIRTSNPAAALALGVENSLKWTKMVGLSFVRMVQNKVSSRNIGGLITIGKFAGQSYKVGLAPFLKLMGILSINLFLLNLLPVPVLDGGHLLFFTIEAIRGSPLSLRKMEIAQQFGLILLMTLMAFSFFNDITNLINPPW